MIGLSGVFKAYGSQPVISGLNLDVQTGECVALLGPSGSGKSTLLRLIAGLEFMDAGRVTIDGRDATHLPPGKRGIGFVFQSYALFEHMTVLENIAFGPRVRHAGRSAARDRAAEMLTLVRLEGLGDRMPIQLSGGQRQRVALARALAVRPRILLLDEPLTALDREVRIELRTRVRQVQRQFGVTTVFVTHDIDDAEALADRIVILERGQIASEGQAKMFR